MAVCGRCWICGAKFDCTNDDVGAIVTCRGESYAIEWPGADEDRRICTACVKAIDGDLSFPGPSEPHGDGMPEGDRLVVLLDILARVAEDRRRRAMELVRGAVAGSK